jgi:16S rRNA processing protein RimM
MYIAVGKIIKVYGVQGHIKAIPYSGFPDRFTHLRMVYIEGGEGMCGFILEDVQVQNEVSLLKLRGIETRETAGTFVKKELWVPEEQQIELPEGEYFIHDLIGLEVFDTDGESVGKLEEVLLNAGNNVYVVREDQREILIPAVPEFIKLIDLQQKKMVVQLIEGMLE